jgi:uncharacterized membrane-anchored protein YjiN (DUF445 family)
MKYYLAYITNDTKVILPAYMQHAIKISEDEVQKEIIEAVLLSGAKSKDIADSLGLQIEVIEAFKELFFDTKVFSSKLDVISYLARLPKSEAKEMKTRAYNLGPEYVYYTYSGQLPTESMQKDLMRRMFMTASYKAMNMHYNAANTASSKSSLEFAKLMVKAFESLEKFASADNSAATELNTYLMQECDFSSALGYNNSNPHINEEEIV